MSSRVLKQEQLQAGTDTVLPSGHGSEGAPPWNSLPASEVAEAKTFINQYAVVHGLPQPVAPRGHNTAAPTYML